MAGMALSVVKHEFFGVEQRPEQILQNFVPVGSLFDGGDETRALRFGRDTAQAADIELIEDFRNIPSLILQFADQPSCFDLSVRVLAVEEVEGLREIRFDVD